MVSSPHPGPWQNLEDAVKTYEWILFDADDTLFQFDSLRGLQRMFSQYGVAFSEDDFLAYEAVNKPLWTDYQNGAISLLQLQQRRFQSWGQKLQLCPTTLNRAYLAAMAEICAPTEGATSLLEALRGVVRLGVITNGFAEIQESRLARTGLRSYFEVLVISEQVGVAKPHRGIFEHALAAMGNPRPEQVLMVGDNPSSDILGGMSAGMDTCWFNQAGKAAPVGITPTYQVSCLLDLAGLLRSSRAAAGRAGPGSGREPYSV
jgi:YjjG family noncanonical pyrimidine nucleotidase